MLTNWKKKYVNKTNAAHANGIDKENGIVFAAYG